MSDVRDAMLQGQADALKDPKYVKIFEEAVDNEGNKVGGTLLERREAQPGAEDFDQLKKTGEGDDLATRMAKEAGEPLPGGEGETVTETGVDLLEDPDLAPIVEEGKETEGEEVLHCLIGKPIQGMKDYFWPVKGDVHPAGVRHCPDGKGRFWFDKVLVNIAGKSEAVYRYDRVNSEKQPD